MIVPDPAGWYPFLPTHTTRSPNASLRAAAVFTTYPPVRNNPIWYAGTCLLVLLGQVSVMNDAGHLCPSRSASAPLIWCLRTRDEDRLVMNSIGTYFGFARLAMTPSIVLISSKGLRKASFWRLGPLAFLVTTQIWNECQAEQSNERYISYQQHGLTSRAECANHRNGKSGTA